MPCDPVAAPAVAADENTFRRPPLIDGYSASSDMPTIVWVAAFEFDMQCRW